MNSKIILGGVAVLVAAVGLVVAMNALKSNPEAKQGAPAPSQNAASEPPKSAPATGDSKPLAANSTAPAVVPSPAGQQATRPEPAPTQSAAPAQASPFAAFGGTWVMDKARSEGLTPDMNQVMTVTPSAGGINIETKLNSARGEESVREDYVLNGREVEFNSRWAGNVPVSGRRVARLTADGKGIEITEHVTINAPSGQLVAEVTRSWALSPDGKTLTIKMLLKSPSIIVDNTRLFVKQ